MPGKKAGAVLVHDGNISKHMEKWAKLHLNINTQNEAVGLSKRSKGLNG